jgi:hypothetical protein
MSAKTKTEQIECEEVVLKIPKAIMVFLRENEGMLEEKAEAYLERCIVGLVAADIESEDCFVLSPIKLAKKYDLQPIFKKFGCGIFDPDC